MAPIRVASTFKTFPKLSGKTPLETLHAVNPNLADVFAKHRGVEKFVLGLVKTGAVAQQKPTDASSIIKTEMWSHSAKSGGMKSEPFGETIVAWQVGPQGKIDLGPRGGVRDGQVVGVFRLDQLAFSSLDDALKMNPKSPGLKKLEDGKVVAEYTIANGKVNKGSKVVAEFQLDKEEAVTTVRHLDANEFKNSKLVLVSDDGTYRGSYEWDSMNLPVYGRHGDGAEVHWAIVDIDANGKVGFGGFPEGFSGRKMRSTIGTDADIKIGGH